MRRSKADALTLELSSAVNAKKLKAAMAETISGNNSKSMVSLPLCEMLREDQHSNTDPNVAIVAAILSTVPSTPDRIGDRFCATGDDFLLFCFCPFAAICRSCWVRLFDLTRTLPVGFVPTVGRTIARRGGELLKAGGKLKVTGSDGLQNSTSLMRGLAGLATSAAFIRRSVRERGCLLQTESNQ